VPIGSKDSKGARGCKRERCQLSGWPERCKLAHAHAFL
jgi:hypothetical protein